MTFLYNISSLPGRVQAPSHNFLSVIFGILGKFGIGIGDPKNFGRKNFRRKKSENFLVENFWDQKFSIFDRKKIVEKVNENSKFSKFRFFF